MHITHFLFMITLIKSAMHAISCATFHSRLRTELFKLAYPDSLLSHHLSGIITDCNRSPTLSALLDLPGFDLPPKRNEKFGYCGPDLV